MPPKTSTSQFASKPAWKRLNTLPAPPTLRPFLLVRSHHAPRHAQQDRGEYGHAIGHGLAAPGAVSAGFAISTRLPSVTFAASPVARTSVGSSPESTSTSFP